MRMVVSCAPGVGHLLPLLPLARTARERGHDVRIATGAGLAPIVQAAGFRHVPVGPATLGDVALAIPGIAGLTGRRRAVVMVREGFAGWIARSIADDLLAGLMAGPVTGHGAWRPDLIVHEDMELGSWVVAERHGIPHATVQVTAWRPRVRELMATALEPIRAGYGLPADATDRLLGSVFFTTRPASMHDPTAPLPEVTAELRPIADDRDGAPRDAVVDLAPDIADIPRPLVAVTLGTVNADRLGIVRALTEGAAATGARVVVGLGGDPLAFGAVPANVAVHRYVPMSALLPHSSVVAFHGGSGTLTAALAAGRPMVIVPIAADQLDNAERAVAAGVARTMAPDTLTVDAARNAIATVLGDPAYARRAAAIAAEVAAMPGPDEALARLEGLVGSG